MEVQMYTRQAEDLVPMLGHLRPEATLVDPDFVSVDHAAALGECEALGLYDDGQPFTDALVAEQFGGAVIA